MTSKKRAVYSPEFKREAVRLLEQGDKEASQLARELGVARNKLYLWKEEIDRHGENVVRMPSRVKVVAKIQVRSKTTMRR